MLKSGSLSRTGKCHECLPEYSWDAVMERDCGTWKAAVLCSGDGGCANGQAAARLTADALTEYLSVYFERCLLEAPEVLRMEADGLITEVLTYAAKKAGADPASFGCKVMAAAMDQQGRWCLFHLGDGTAVGKPDADGDWFTFSYAQRGLPPSATSLTMGDTMFRDLRFYRQVQPADRALFLLTGDMPEAFAILPEPEEHPELLGSPELLGEPENDCSAAWLIARQEPDPPEPPQ